MTFKSCVAGLALIVAPTVAGAVTLAETIDVSAVSSGFRSTIVFPDDPSPLAFAFVADEEVEINFSVSAVALTSLDLFATSYILSEDINATPTIPFSAAFDPTNPTAVSFPDAGSLTIDASETGYLIFAASAIDLLDQVQISFFYDTEAVSPVAPIPLPAPAGLLLAGLAGLAIMKRRR